MILFFFKEENMFCHQWKTKVFTFQCVPSLPSVLSLVCPWHARLCTLCRLNLHMKWKRQVRGKENKFTQAHQTFTEGTEPSTHWAQLCPHQNQINKVKIKRKKGTKGNHSLIRAQLSNLKSVSARTCWHSASARWWSNFLHTHANWCLQFSSIICHPRLLQSATSFWGFWMSIKSHNVVTVFARSPVAWERRMRNKNECELNKLDKRVVFK